MYISCFILRPVFMSSLSILPVIACSFNETRLIAILTANAEKLKMMGPLIEEKCRLNTRAANFVIVGCEEVDGYEAVANGDKVDTTKVI